MQIKNNRLDFNKALHPHTISIPSSERPLFWDERKRDFGTRASFEAQKYVGKDGKKGGCLIFVLLTYNPEHRPHFPNSDVPCFNRYHVSTLIRSLKDHYGRGHFSYLVGAEYGVDPKHQRLPHYHCLFMLDKTIHPRGMMEYIRKVWTGEKYYENKDGKQSWKYGNLGFVFPSPKDCDKADACRATSPKSCKHDYLARDHGACATYAAKYAVKSIGFFRDKEVLREMSKYNKHDICYMLPRAFASQKFGFNMIEEDTFDPIRNKVYDALRLKEVNIPPYIMRSFLYKRVWRGREKEEILGFKGYDIAACDKACRNDIVMRYGDGYQYCALPPAVYFQYRLKHLQEYPIFEDIKVTKLYDQELLSHGYPIKIARLLECISRDTLRISSTYGCGSVFARRYSIFKRVYSSLPSAIMRVIFGNIFPSEDDYYKESTFVSVYLYCYLYRKLDFPHIRCGSFAQDCLSPLMAQLFQDIEQNEEIRNEKILVNEYNMAIKMIKANICKHQLRNNGEFDSSLLVDVKKPSTPLIDYKKYCENLDLYWKSTNIANKNIKYENI